MYFNSPYSFMQPSMYNQGIAQGFSTGYLVNIAKRKTEKFSEGPYKDENEHTGMSSLDIIKEMHTEYMHNLAKVKELMNLRQ